MLRWLLIGVLVFGLGTGMRDGWVIVKWPQLLHNLGLKDIDPNKPLRFGDFIQNER